jgi:capsular polysaccharide biosynthesis protein
VLASSAVRKTAEGKNSRREKPIKMKAYVEGCVRYLWLLLVIMPLCLGAGRVYAQSATTTYTASTSILLNAPLLVATAVPSKVVKLSIPVSYAAQVMTPTVLATINKHYPRLSIATLKANITIAIDPSNHILLIRVTDSKPEAAADIANYLALQFVRSQRAILQHELNYYQQWLQQQITRLNDEVNVLNMQIKALQPVLTRPSDHPILLPAQRIVLNADQYRVNNDVRDLYVYSQALQDIKSALPLFQKAYIIQHEAKVSDIPIGVPLAESIALLIASAFGLFIYIALVIVLEYFSPFIRHRGEVERLADLPVLTDLPKIFSFEQKRLLDARPALFRRRLDALRLLCGSLGIRSLKEGNHTILLTSLHQKYRLAGLLATLLARGGYRTLVIEADVDHPYLLEQIRVLGPGHLQTDDGLPLLFIAKTSSPLLFVLSANAMLSQDEPLTPSALLVLLPALQKLFQVIIIDGPPLNQSATHMLAAHVQQTLLLIQKRRDRVQTLKMTARQCQDLHIQMQVLLLS